MWLVALHREVIVDKAVDVGDAFSNAQLGELGRCAASNNRQGADRVRYENTKGKGNNDSARSNVAYRTRQWVWVWVYIPGELLFEGIDMVQIHMGVADHMNELPRLFHRGAVDAANQNSEVGITQLPRLVRYRGSSEEQRMQQRDELKCSGPTMTLREGL